MANITLTEVGDGLATIIAANALGALKANTVAARLVARDWDTDVAQYGQTITIPERGALSVNDKGANSVVALQTPADSPHTVTLDKHKEVSFLIEDVAKALARPDYLNGYIEDGIKAVAEQIDADILALYSGLSQTRDATSGLGKDDFVEVRRLLNAAKVPSRDRFAILHEDAEAEMWSIAEFISADYNALSEGSADQLAANYMGRFLGFNVYTDQMVATATSQCKNIFGHRNFAALVTRPLPLAPAGMGVVQTTMAEDDMGLRVTMGYNKDHLGLQVTIDVLYGVAELRDNHAVAVSTTEI